MIHQANARTIAILPLAAVTLLAGCGGQKKALDLNNAASTMTKRLESGGVQFGTAVSKAQQTGAPQDIAEVRKQYNNLTSLMDQARKEADAMKVDGINGGAEFRDAYVKFLQQQDKMLKEEFKEMVELMEDNSLPPFQRQQKLQNAFQRAAAAEGQALPIMKTAQENFARKNNFKLQ
jgi:hypothetical protein